MNNIYSYHLREILSAVRNEYTNWSDARQSSVSVRDSLLEALSDGHTAAPLLRLAYLHSRRGATTYFFHLAHQPDSSLRKLVRRNRTRVLAKHSDSFGNTLSWIYIMFGGVEDYV